MHFIIYETTNLVNNKKYRGAHICKTLDDNYIGSGKLLLKAIAKYGFENFERKILMECNSTEHMFEQEAMFVNKEWINRKDTYNLKLGGEGGWDYINKNRSFIGVWTDERKKAQSERLKLEYKKGNFSKNFIYSQKGSIGRKLSEETKKKISENNGSNLSKEEIDKRINDWNMIPNKRGKIKIISNLWNVSHTQVRRFVKKYITE